MGAPSRHSPLSTKEDWRTIQRWDAHRDKLHQGRRKEESSLGDPTAHQEDWARSLSPRLQKSPDMISLSCQCGCRQQDPKRVIAYCPNHARNRRKLYEAVGTNR